MTTALGGNYPAYEDGSLSQGAFEEACEYWGNRKRTDEEYIDPKTKANIERIFGKHEGVLKITDFGPIWVPENEALIEWEPFPDLREFSDVTYYPYYYQE